MEPRVIHGIVIKERTEPVLPVKIDLSGPEGERVVRVAAKRVIATHEKVLKALAKR